MAENEIPVHPIQTRNDRTSERAVVPQVVTLRAYEVYCKVFGKQDALVTGHCRGGFGTGELIAFLYARSFPADEWRKRFDEAITGMKNTG